MPKVLAAATPKQPARPKKRIIDVSVDNLSLRTGEAWEAIKEQNSPPILFLNGPHMIRVRYDYHDDTVIIERVDPDIMRHELAEMAEWRKANNAVTKPPMFLVRNVLASRVIPLPRLQRVVTVPVFAPDGSLLTEPGYSEASGLIYAPPRGYKTLPVPERVTDPHLEEAKKLIDEMLQDFPFATDEAGDSSDHDNAIALMLLPFVRDMIDGPTPNHLIEASMEGSGKGLLATSLLYPGLGKIDGTPQPENDTELKKFLTAQIRACVPLIYLDNISRTVASGELAAALTMSNWSDRVLGESVAMKAEVRNLWLMTGNNISMSREIARRTIRIRLTPQTDRPEERSNFAHPDQVGWIKENRPALVWACHVICRYAIQQGLPVKKPRVIGSYEHWSKVMGSILYCAGYHNFLDNYRDVQSGSNTEREALATFAVTWWEWLEKLNEVAAKDDRPEKTLSTTSELWEIAKNIEGLPVRGRDDDSRLKSMGHWLKSKHEVIVEYSSSDDPSSPYETQKFKILFRGIGKGTHRGSKMWGIECLERNPKK